MRYAAPPVGRLRWRAPEEPSLQRTGTVELATSFRPICLCTGSGYPSYGQDEDCLFVNVWAPSDARPGSKLPVWVFIQGGGYVSLTNANWNGAEVVEKSGGNTVMVNFNYRVGLWGFLASENIRKDGDLNAGLLDQRMLLKWVKTHIAQFGGDPDHVVIHGASAGAGSVALHMVAYGGRDDDLFVGGIAESIFFPAQPPVAELEYQFQRVVEQTGCDSARDQMQCLRETDAAWLQAANRAQPFPGRDEPPLPLFYWTPCVDGEFLQDIPYRLFQKGKFVNVPVLFGTTTDEGSVFASNAATQTDFAAFMANNYPKLTSNQTDAILQHYPKLPPLPWHEEWFPSASQAYGEATFICPTVNVLNTLQHSSDSSLKYNNAGSGGSGSGSAGPGPGIWSYRYNVYDSENTAEGLGVQHLFEAAAVFGPDNINGARRSYWTYNAPIVPVVMSYWISFVRTLDPNIYRSPGSPNWEKWGADMNRLVMETGNTHMETVGKGVEGPGGEGGELERCRFWEGLGGVMEQ
ncbi:lipase 1 [Diplogelasinospora grovesii]|uniref:Carboxylic ester hydrolase n=1 Tax=Diplogelasinospora grovesii TaxID=303347 RepID=A0AAN6MZ52_9PEZI|nr:lipase 1 [Diplogelasinospora grovesii]